MKELELKELIQAAVAQGWCVPPNTHKEMDCALAEAIVNKVLKALDAHDAALREEIVALYRKMNGQQPGDEDDAFVRAALKREKRGEK